jgi:Fic family protein
MKQALKERIGHKVRSSGAGPEPYFAYIPRPLPPKPPLELTNLQTLIERASQAVGRLDGLTTVLPDSELFLYMYIRKEALLSSQIEGTQSSLSDLLLYENAQAPGVPINDVQEVSNYVAAMEYGLKRLKSGFPLSMRLIKEIHGILMSGARGGKKAPGEFRRTQNWIGGSRPGNAKFVPPPPDKVIECMSDLEKFLHTSDDKLPILAKAALMHHQFETIHPFLDGNGRLGRLLITLLLCTENVLTQPVLYLSLYFKIHRDRYYDLLNSVRESGDWESWLEFFLEGVLAISEQASETAKEILTLIENDRIKISGIGRGASSAMQIYRYLERKPLAVITEIVKELKLSTPTVTSSLQKLEELGLVREITGKQRGRIFVYDAYLRILNRGTEPIVS